MNSKEPFIEKIIPICLQHLSQLSPSRPAYAQMNIRASAGRLIFALNIYNQPSTENILKTLLPSLKKGLKKAGISSRYVNKNYQNLATATTIAEKLVPTTPINSIGHISPICPLKPTHPTSSLELNLIFSKTAILLGQTVAIQDIVNYSKRDYEKPSRTPHSGMLPPKLAQIMINLNNPSPCIQACPEYSRRGEVRRGSENWNKTPQPKQNLKAQASTYPLSLSPYPFLIDPFCGSGTILMEALLMGYNVLGSDINEKAIASTKANIDWLKQNFSINPQLNSHIFQEDALKLTFSSLLNPKPYTLTPSLVTEPYLGPPLNKEPTPVEIDKIQTDLKKLYLAFFTNLKNSLPERTPIIIIFPYLKAHHKRYFLQINPLLENLGFQTENLIPPELQTRFNLKLNQFPSLLYERKDQIVGREIWKFTKK